MAGLGVQTLLTGYATEKRGRLERKIVVVRW